jgi:hypothetical protein
MYAYGRVQRDAEALRVARGVLRKDPEFLDVRCACTAFLWAMGEGAAAEGEWNQLQQAQGALFIVCMQPWPDVLPMRSVF